MQAAPSTFRRKKTNFFDDMQQPRLTFSTAFISQSNIEERKSNFLTTGNRNDLTSVRTFVKRWILRGQVPSSLSFRIDLLRITLRWTKFWILSKSLLSLNYIGLLAMPNQTIKQILYRYKQPISKYPKLYLSNAGRKSVENVLFFVSPNKLRVHGSI